MTVEVIEAGPAEIPILRRLMQLYLYDIGTVDGWDLNDDGSFGSAQRIEGFWSDERRRRFLVRVDGKLAGFALIREGSHFGGEDTREISEFFILRKYHRQGIGARVATWVFDRFPGKWEVAEMASNTDAQAFWRAVIGRYTASQFEEFSRRDDRWAGVVQHFDNTRPAPPR